MPGGELRKRASVIAVAKAECQGAMGSGVSERRGSERGCALSPGVPL